MPKPNKQPLHYHKLGKPSLVDLEYPDCLATDTDSYKLIVISWSQNPSLELR